SSLDGRLLRAGWGLLRIAHRAHRLREAVLVAEITRRAKRGDERRVALGTLRLGKSVLHAPVCCRRARPAGCRLRIADWAHRLREAVLLTPVAGGLKLRDQLGVALGAPGLGQAVSGAPICDSGGRCAHIRDRRPGVADRAERLGEAVLRAPVAAGLIHGGESRSALGAKCLRKAVFTTSSRLRR